MERFVIVTGMSGAGKSLVLKYLEDIGFFCADNLPPTLVPKFAEICFKPGTEIERVALGIDIRGGKLFNDLFSALTEIKAQGFSYDILFLDSTDAVLIKRFKETRRAHPLAKNDRLSEAITQERQLLEEIKLKATYTIETSQLLTRQLKEQINDIFLEDKNYESLTITVVSFGYKYGLPSDSDLVFDVRFIPNPFYIDHLKENTGEDENVKEFVLGWEESQTFLAKTNDFLEFLIPNYIKEGKTRLDIAVGCTGGKHRSVALANEVYKTLKERGHRVVIIHRDVASSK